MAQTKWFWPSLIVISALLAYSLVLTNSTFGLRPLFTLWFLLVCPGMAFVRLLPNKEVVVQWTLAIALSLALDALVAAVLVYTHHWSPNIALVILIEASLAGVGLQVTSREWSTSRKSSKSSMRVEVDDLWYRKLRNIFKRHITDLSSIKSFIKRYLTQIKPVIPAKRNDRILLIETEKDARESISNFLQASGYEMSCVQDSDEAVNILASAKPDLILFDTMSPGIESWEILGHLRERSSVPIIILTSKREKADILHGFSLGVDDYLAKPLLPKKLGIRVAAVLSRSRAIHASKEIVTSDELTINFKQKQVMANGEKVNLTPTEYKLLEVLARHANRTIPMSVIHTEVWGSGLEVDVQSIRQVIWSLRKKIEPDIRKPKHLITRHGFGYRFE